MRSKLYLGEVTHIRVEPVKNEFIYPLCVYSIDLDELDELDKNIAWFGYNRFAAAAIHDEDYLSLGKLPIKEKVKIELKRAGVEIEPHKVTLVTTPKIFGVGFNPVSFYYCADSSGKNFAYIAEITNTFSERAVYVFSGSENKFTHEKKFHVSPFYSISGEYEVTFGELNESLNIIFNLKRPGEKVFHAKMYGKASSFDHHKSTFLKYGVTILMTLPRIYLQAINLHFFKKLPVFQKPNPPLPPMTIRADAYSWLDQFCIWQTRKALRNANWGCLEFIYPDGKKEFYGDPNSSVTASIKLNNFKMFWKLIKDGGIGFGESYVDGDWSTPSLTDVMTFVLNNAHTVDESKYNWLKPTRFLNLIDLILKSNSKKQAKKNISDHYDLGNDMFSLFLDPTLSYSSAKFLEGSSDLELGQREKIRSILGKAKISPGDKLLEIGSGWGELAVTAAQEYGCSVTGITISEEQAKLSREKIKQRGLSDKISIEIKDYREVNGKFDKVVSVEMIEAVGREYLGTFLSTIDRVLAPDGMVVLQIIAYHDNDYKNYLKRQDWIQKHIFPGSHLPSLTAFCEAMASHSDLVIESIENLPHHYAKTLAIWRENFNAQKTKLAELGYDERFQRAWNFYLSSCEAEFATRWLALYQIVLTRPNNLKLAAEYQIKDEEVSIKAA